MSRGSFILLLLQQSRAHITVTIRGTFQNHLLLHAHNKVIIRLDQPSLELKDSNRRTRVEVGEREQSKGGWRNDTKGVRVQVRPKV